MYNLANDRNGLVQRSTDHIDSPSFYPLTVDGARRSQVIVENGLRCGLENKEWLKPGTDPIHDTSSTDRRLGSWVDALEIFTKCETTDVDYVLERPASTIDLSFFLAELASLQADVDAILATRTFEPQAAPTALADDTVLDVLFSGTAEEEFAPTHTKGKRHRSSRTEEEKAQKRQRRQENEVRKASILDEELRQRRVRESIAGASSYAPVVEVPPVVRDVVSTTAGAVRVIESTIEGAMMEDVGTTEGDPTIVPACSGKPDPPAC
uniref:Integrase core domain containing protein n=1 Tax=Solanum tuberosum TaxID=4113 RepID=M1DSQ1_SOLTU